MSFSQKLVQTRVWAQGLTLASLLGMAAITQIPSAGDHILREREQAADHSWKDFVGDGNAETVSHGIAAHSAKHSIHTVCSLLPASVRSARSSHPRERARAVRPSCPRSPLAVCEGRPSLHRCAALRCDSRASQIVAFAHSTQDSHALCQMSYNRARTCSRRMQGWQWCSLCWWNLQRPPGRFVRYDSSRCNVKHADHNLPWPVLPPSSCTPLLSSCPS